MSDMFENSAAHKTSPQPGQQHTGLFVGLFAGLVIALGGIGYIAMRNSQLSDQIAQMQDSTQAQISKLSAATTSLLEERLQSVNQEIDAVKTTGEKTSTAVRQTRAQAQKQSEELQSKLDEQQKQTTDELAQLKDTTSNTSNTLNAVSSDVNNVKTDVGGVRNDVVAVKTDLGTTQSNLEKTSSDLKRAMGDMGVMSGLIATNAKDLSALRALGERNYVEFDISRKDAAKKIGDISVTLKKADIGHNRYTVAVFADDKLVEKRDRTINEPVQLYINGNRLPYEIVVNQVKKDEIVGYLSTPKMTVARNQ
jgi:DNA repair exonuclease SbcCD ATPase subunit